MILVNLPVQIQLLTARKEGLFDVAQERKEPALRMAKEVWQEAHWEFQVETENG